MFVDWLQDSSGTARLEKAEPLVDGRNTRQWKLTFLEVLVTREDTNQLPMFPGAEQAFQDAVDETWSHDGKATPLKGKRVEMDLSFSVGDPHADPPTHKAFSIEGLDAEIRFLKLKTNPTTRTRTTTVWLHGVSLEHAEAIVTAQAEAVRVTVRARAPQAFILAGKPDEPEEGQLVAGRHNGRAVCGLMIRTDPAGHPVVDNFGAIYPLEGDSPPLALHIETADDLPPEDHAKHYADDCRSRNLVPSWDHVLTAATALWADGKLTRPTGGTLYVNTATFGRALDDQLATNEPTAATGT